MEQVVKKRIQNTEISRQNKKRKHPYSNEWYCRECGKDCFRNPIDYYMLKDDIWFKINGKFKGMLCMECLENRLGHKLTSEEILRCPLTEETNPYTKHILLNEATP